jgi:ribosomal-protein-alanine N-acetyltransferase
VGRGVDSNIASISERIKKDYHIRPLQRFGRNMETDYSPTRSYIRASTVEVDQTLETPASFAVRRFEEKDLGSVMEINRTCLPENYSASFFLDVYAKFPEAFLVAVNGDMVVAYIMCRLERGFSEVSKFRFVKKGHIISVAVLPEHRRKGIASELIRQAEKSLVEREAEEYFLEVRVSNKSAQDLYKALDFMEARTISFYYYNGEDAVVMSKALK